MRKLFLVLSVVLTGCSAQQSVNNRPVTVFKPVAQPCVSGERPEIVPPLKERIDDGEWVELDVRQKAAHVSKHAADLRKYSEDLFAATGACK